MKQVTVPGFRKDGSECCVGGCKREPRVMVVFIDNAKRKFCEKHARQLGKL